MAPAFLRVLVHYSGEAIQLIRARSYALAVRKIVLQQLVK